MIDLIGHGALLAELRSLAASPSPPHAMLFDGPESTGKRPLVRLYAMLLNCLQRGTSDAAGLPCGQCRPCRLIAAGSHADFVEIGIGDTLCRPRPGASDHSHETTRNILICQVRGLIDLVARFPLEANVRVVVIEPAEKLTMDAQNALLKVLEEPPDRTAIVLVTAAPQDLLETVVSRCRRFDVRPVARIEIESALLARGADPAVATRAAEQARGRPGVALALAEQPGLLDDRERLLHRCDDIASSPIARRFEHAQDLARRWRGDPPGVLKELAAWEEFWEIALRAAAASDQSPGAIDTARAIQAIAACRDDLLFNVIPQAALERMVLSFPRRTLEHQRTEEPQHV
jgi:DNA polymerase-3 subunit delta'